VVGRFNRIAYFAAASLVLLSTTAVSEEAKKLSTNQAEERLAWWAEADGRRHLLWRSNSGREVCLRGLSLALADKNDARRWVLELISSEPRLEPKSAIVDYRISLDDVHRSVTGSARLLITLPEDEATDVLLCRSSLQFDQPVNVDLLVRYTFDVIGDCPEQMLVPERQGKLIIKPLLPNTIESGYFRLGNSAETTGIELGMPVIDLSWTEPQEKTETLRLTVAVDPYCGSSISAVPRPGKEQPTTRIAISTLYRGSQVPFTSEKRTVSLEFHRNGVDGSLRSFYRTIPEIKPGPLWTHGIHLVYYDYLSERGEGWFRDLQTLADRIPPEQRGRVAACLHGWYDYFQQYAYDHQQKKLLCEWTAFPGTFKIPMSLEKMHRRIQFAKNLGFRTLLYFADGTNSDSGAPNFHSEYLLKDKNGNTFPGWKGPDSIGQPLKMDPGVPELRSWYRDYLCALVEEYGNEVDGLVWDETFYIPTDFISYPNAMPTYADRAMMSLVSELTCIVQQHWTQNKDLALLVADNGSTNYALVAHGTFQDSACRPAFWGPSMFANYRNCLWSCNWYPVSGALNNQIAAVRFGLPQGVSNGYGDDLGPHEMPRQVLDDILERFSKNVSEKRERLRYLGVDGVK